MEQNRTLMDEARVELAAQLDEMAKKPGLDGAFARLAKIVDPNQVGAFIAREMTAATPPRDITRAIAQVIAYQIAIVACSSTNPQRQLAILSALVNEAVTALLSGDAPIIAVQHDLKNGREDHTTLVGMFNRGGH